MFFGDAHSGSVFIAAFLASLVEFVEALTIVLAVGTVRGWRSALLGAGLGTALLVLLILLLGPALSLIPITWLQLTVGVLLLLFGIRWLRKAILRAAGVIALHDEARAYETEAAELRRAGTSRFDGIDVIAAATSFKAVVLEGLEVVFIVIAIGATGQMLVPASIGAGAALAAVLLLGLIIHRPLTKVPENALKLVVGVMISAFGVFWIGEGLGDAWPGADWAIPGLCLGFLAAALLAIPLVRATLTKRAVPS
jgi:Ca2+/H+ antiporter, TMEM165/GDT1 family